jgi:serine/threonine protein kinase
MIANEAFELVKSLQSGGFANVVEILHVPTRKRYALKKTALEYLDYAENEVQVMLDLKSATRVIKLYSHQNGPDVFYTVFNLHGFIVDLNFQNGDCNHVFQPCTQSIDIRSWNWVASTFSTSPVAVESRTQC